MTCEDVPAAGADRRSGWCRSAAATFRAAVARLTEAGVPRHAERPRWVGYWSFPVRDPMGTTVELTPPVAGEPPSTAWM